MLIGVRLRSGVLRVDGEAVPEGCRVEVMMDASFFRQVLELGQVVGSEVVGELVLNPETLDIALLLHAHGGGDDDGVQRDLLEVPGEGGVFYLFPVVGNGLLLRGWIAGVGAGCGVGRRYSPWPVWHFCGTVVATHLSRTLCCSTGCFWGAG